MKRPILALAVSALAVLSAGCGTPAGADEPAATPTRAPEGPRTTLVVGSVSDDPEEEAEVFQPFADHVAAQLADAGVTGGEVAVAATTEEMAELLRTGAVDLYVDSMYGATRVVADGAAAPLLRRWKDGTPEYHSVVVARADSGLTSLAQLAGRTVAFEEDTSTDGWFLPAATVLEQGLPMVEQERPDAEPVPGTVGYVFSGDDENTVFQVLQGLVDAGALSEEDLAENAGSRAGELVVLGRTIAVPRHGVVARVDLDPAVRDAVVAVLTALHEDAEGRAVLEEFDGTARFDVLPPEGLEPILRLLAVLDAGTA
ncbi:phosphate/phosphite/phosphonate ABC transporter substrate-binding protein [Geodermatophilus sp. YIM 151500]|uniref:phosphate/phosphite/phosphonate ABC transporter substrate-binding protein n=1 Tax=Geodermatophilus sp. YIM 151500 TaxID=2984531 RepID=UPI0021E4353B|nr:phosphate/phosphite/phosphonate ABC transporter substrate-binding protein [Geodermatophilus sp. YIM 151500]MCV2490194.1 phosphate/phosphite/phosphonate ABC transporter substrate-binding protein [Geodermatophilus sp. YIM 151500]